MKRLILLTGALVWSAVPAFASNVTLFVTSGGLSAVNAEASSTIFIEIDMQADQPMGSWQANLTGDSAFSHPGVEEFNYDPTPGWDVFLPFTQGPGNLPTGVIGTTAEDIFAGATNGIAFSLELTVPTDPGDYTISLSNVIVGEVNFDSFEEISVVPLTVTVTEPVPEPAAISIFGAAALTLCCFRRR